MKTLIETSTGLSKYLFRDESEVTILSNGTLATIKQGTLTLDNFEIADLNSSNATLVSVQESSVPTDWIGNKYLLIDGAFVPNPDWVEPTTEEVVEENEE